MLAAAGICAYACNRSPLTPCPLTSAVEYRMCARALATTKGRTRTRTLISSQFYTHPHTAVHARAHGLYPRTCARTYSHTPLTLTQIFSTTTHIRTYTCTRRSFVISTHPPKHTHTHTHTHALQQEKTRLPPAPSSSARESPLWPKRSCESCLYHGFLPF